MSDAASPKEAASVASPKGSVHSHLKVEARAIRHILVPVDHSEHAEYAFRWAMANVFRPSDVIHIATVTDVPMKYNSPDRTPRTLL